MTRKRKKHLWTKLLSMLLIASMMVSDMAMSSFAASMEESVAVENSTQEDMGKAESEIAEPGMEAPVPADPGAKAGGNRTRDRRDQGD